MAASRNSPESEQRPRQSTRGLPARFQDCVVGADLEALSPSKDRKRSVATAAVTATFAAAGAEAAAAAPPLPPAPRRSKRELGPVGVAPDGEPVYKVTLRDVAVRDGEEQQALVHYVGWDSSYDEWRPFSCLSEAVSGLGGR